MERSTKSSRIVYIAGPFSAPTREGVERNIAQAQRVALELAAKGIFYISPHLNSAHADFEIVRDKRFWLEMYLNILNRCDALLVFGDYTTSEGTLSEIAFANAANIPIFYDIPRLDQWYRNA